jgi:GNAT superfamily N-acetyltransferase
VLEAAFPANTREINEEYLRKTMRYLCERDGTVVGLSHTEKDGKRHFLQVLAVSTDRRGCGLGTYLLARAAHDIPAKRSLYVQADTTDVQRDGGGTTSAQAFYEKHGMVECGVDDAEDCIALRASASALRDLGAKRPDGLVGCSYAFDDDDIASLPAEVLVEDSSDGEEGQTDEEGASAAYDVDSIPAGELPDTAKDNMGNGGCTAHALFKLGV